MKIDALILDPRAQPRAQLDWTVIAEYAVAMEGGDVFPPIVAFGDEQQAFVGDGWHRVHAAEETGLDEIAVDLRPGGLAEAIWHACGANATHGLRRTNADKRRAVATALGVRPDLSDREIAGQCGVSPTTVGTLRAELSVQVGQIAERTVTRNGVTYVQDTTNIGQRQPNVARLLAPPLSAAPESPFHPDHPSNDNAPAPFVMPEQEAESDEERAYFTLSRQRLLARYRASLVADTPVDPTTALPAWEEFEVWFLAFMAALRARAARPIRLAE